MAERYQGAGLMPFPATGDNCTQHGMWAEASDFYTMRYTYVSGPSWSACCCSAQ